MGDNVMGSFRTNRPPRGRRLGRGRGFRTFRLVRRWFRHESGGIERIAWPLTGSVCSFIVRSIPEGLMFRGIQFYLGNPGQEAIAFINGMKNSQPLQFVNFRD